MRKSTLLSVMVAVVLALGTGCGASDGDEPTGDSQGATSSSGDAGSDTIAEEELDGELVDSFPSDQVPLYPGDVVSSLGGMADYTEKPEWGVDITTTDSFDEVDAAIRQAYSADGWQINSESDHPLGGFMLIARSDSYIATITYLDADNETSINYGVSKI